MSLNESGSIERIAESTVLKLLARIFQVVGVPVAVAIMTLYLQSGADERKSINQTLNDLNGSVRVLQSQTRNIYTSDDADRDFKRYDIQIGDLRDDYDGLSKRVDGNTHRLDVLEAWRTRAPRR